VASSSGSPLSWRAMAEFEYALMSERTRGVLDAARARARTGRKAEAGGTAGPAGVCDPERVPTLYPDRAPLRLATMASGALVLGTPAGLQVVWLIVVGTVISVLAWGEQQTKS